MPRRERSQVTNPRKKLCGEGETEEMPEREEAGRGGICPKKMSAQGGIAGNAYQVTPGDERARITPEKEEPGEASQGSARLCATAAEARHRTPSEASAASNGHKKHGRGLRRS
ncbi:hypothetical protein GUJ93_ZPchr0152g29211 [Zizania palustris]|uniref:Uncharacterized protein n=1 Tax=Zizania palustris TaxID=103762 RepID=A0A8J5REK3_ZIZPA|nr:hypothetical protein GUJ93_ZPchr0152g29211 [Zizania palustris]